MKRVAVVSLVLLSVVVFTACMSVAAQPEPQPARVERVNVSIQSLPDPAEIYLESKFIGSTPANVALTPGVHRIEIRRPGFKPWSRELTVLSGSPARVSALLEKE